MNAFSSFIRQILKYDDMIFDNLTRLLLNKLENLQIEAMRFVTQCTKSVIL